MLELFPSDDYIGDSRFYMKHGKEDLKFNSHHKSVIILYFNNGYVRYLKQFALYHNNHKQ